MTGHTVAADLLLETARALYRERRQITVKSVCNAANVPTITALRHLRWLHEQGLVERLSHPRDARSTHVRLTAIAIVAMASYLDEI